VDRALLSVEKQLVADSGEQLFGRERVRNLYRLAGDARPEDMIKAMAAQRTSPRRSAKRPESAKTARTATRRATAKM